MTKVLNRTVGIADLASRLAEEQDISKVKARIILDRVRDKMVAELTAGHRVNFFGLGVLEVRDTKPKIGRNPKTGQQIAIPARKKVIFKASKHLKESI
ncbi:MAG: HU family DNA-binding protein [Holophagaceae bacterium]|mgnify:CR=1 FL=1|jgi:nucleoid DNA-binding protein|nr:HU family DNA-binding protein [Acidobacteriota bacterium]